MNPLLWTDNAAAFEVVPNVRILQTLQVALRMETPLNWSHGGTSAFRSLESEMIRDRDFALDVLDFLVQHIAPEEHSARLNMTLTMGGSAWEVANIGAEGPRLAARAIGPVTEAINALMPASERAHHHLSTAWQKLAGRSPDPSGAYREAIRAVEAVAKPTVTPDDDRATLGKIIAAIRAKPDKWEVVLGNSSPVQIADMGDLIWKGQQDRHGTDDPSTPLNVSQQEADAAVHIALSLTRLFASGGMRLSGDR